MQSFDNEPEVRSIFLQDDGTYPNNPRPLLLYLQAVPLNPEDIEQLFTANQWPSAWRNGVYSYHHYHSTAHEVLGVYGGSATILFGGPEGKTVTIRAGDVAVIDLDEGTRFVSNIVDCDPGDVEIEMRVEMKMETVDDSWSLPVFRPVS